MMCITAVFFRHCNASGTPVPSNNSSCRSCQHVYSWLCCAIVLKSKLQLLVASYFNANVIGGVKRLLLFLKLILEQTSEFSLVVFSFLKVKYSVEVFQVLFRSIN